MAEKGNPDAVAPKYAPTKNLEYKPDAIKDETVGDNGQQPLSR